MSGFQMLSNVKTLKIAIMVTTFRRLPGLLKTLESLISQKSVAHDYSIHVIDNDCDKAVEAEVMKIAEQTPLKIDYHPEAKRGVASARNRALTLVSEIDDYIAFIDDDEIASPHWLASLVKTAQFFDADVVQGPVEPIYSRSAPPWFVRGRLTALGPFREGHELRFGFSGNVLLSAPMLRQTGLRFDPRFDRTGGEDQHFFMALMEAGIRIVTSRDAIVFETIPSSRIALSDYLKRRFRIGATLTQAWQLLRPDTRNTSFRICVGSGHAVLGIAQCALPWRWNGHALALNAGRVAYGFGQIMGALGISNAPYDTIHGSHRSHQQDGHNG